MTETVLIPRRFCGPPDSGNGGYSCGVVGTLLEGPAEVTLRKPPALDVPLEVVRQETNVSVMSNGELVAEAKPAVIAIEAPKAPSFEEAVRASERFLWRENHVYPTCFVCGPKRKPGDGLNVFPGAVEGREIAAAPFIPDETVVDADGRVLPVIVWSVLDCPSWFGFHCFNESDGRVLLGRLAVRIDKPPQKGDRCIVAGWSRGRDGRKIFTASALYAEDGELLAIGESLWIALK